MGLERISAVMQGVLWLKLAVETSAAAVIGIGVAVGIALIAIDAGLGALKWLRIPPLAVGIGIYLPMTATFAVVIGSICSKWYEGVAARAASCLFPANICVSCFGTLVVSRAISRERVSTMAA